MCELAILLEWAITAVEVVLAHLSFVLLLQSVPLALVSVKVIVVRLLGQVSHDLAWWVVEIFLWLSVFIKLSSVLSLLWLDSTNDSWGIW